MRASESYELQVDMIQCDAYGYCAELLPDVIELDEWGYPMISGEVSAQGLDEARRAAAACPKLALRVARREAPGMAIRRLANMRK